MFVSLLYIELASHSLLCCIPLSPFKIAHCVSHDQFDDIMECPFKCSMGFLLGLAWSVVHHFRKSLLLSVLVNAYILRMFICAHILRMLVCGHILYVFI